MSVLLGVSALKGRVTGDAILQTMNVLVTLISKLEHYRSLLLHRDPFNSAEFWNSFPYAREIITIQKVWGRQQEHRRHIFLITIHSFDLASDLISSALKQILMLVILSLKWEGEGAQHSNFIDL